MRSSRAPQTTAAPLPAAASVGTKEFGSRRRSEPTPNGMTANRRRPATRGRKADRRPGRFVVNDHDSRRGAKAARTRSASRTMTFSPRVRHRSSSLSPRQYACEARSKGEQPVQEPLRLVHRGFGPLAGSHRSSQRSAPPSNTHSGATLVTMHPLALLAAVFALAGFTHVADEPQGGQLLKGTFPGTVRAGFVYLPPKFDRTHRYPVVYLLHGLPGSPTEYVDGTQIGQFADAEVASGAMRPFIAVIPAAGKTPSYNGEWAGPWEDALVNQVLPWVDSQLPTIPSRSGRIIAGLSAGGFGAIDIALRHPTLFGTAESWSGYFDPLLDGPFAHTDRQTLAAHDPTRLIRSEATALRHAGLRFFISTGPYHSRQIDPASSNTFAQELRDLGLPVEFYANPNKKGEWRNQLDAGLRWALPPP